MLTAPSSSRSLIVTVTSCAPPDASTVTLYTFFSARGTTLYGGSGKLIVRGIPEGQYAAGYGEHIFIAPAQGPADESPVRVIGAEGDDRRQSVLCVGYGPGPGYLRRLIHVSDVYVDLYVGRRTRWVRGGHDQLVPAPGLVVQGVPSS